MAKIYCGELNDEIISVARMIANNQREVVKIITPTETLEVSYEEVSEVQGTQTEETS